VQRSSVAEGEEFFAARGVGVRFGGLSAFEDVNFSVAQGELYGIIGPNGAGKTTLLNCISGVLRPQEGTLRLRGKELTRQRAHRVAKLGVARTFQTVENFDDFEVADFVMLGRVAWRVRSIIRSGFALPGVATGERRARAHAIETLDRFGLADLAGERIGELPYGTRKMVDVVRALASEPELLLLDEPTSGSSGAERTLLREMMSILEASDTTAIVVDHDVGFISSSCHRLMAMAFGRQLADGPSASVLEHPEVIAAYLGSS
jgi:ABC-type branched-subunit amino acid transport system ATPase component